MSQSAAERGAPGAAVSALLDRHFYDAVEVLLQSTLGADNVPDRLRQAHRLAAAARRVLDLDAEDFGEIASGFHTDWAQRLAESSFPLEPRDPQRGALRSLVPLYELMLEVLQLRATRR